MADVEILASQVSAAPLAYPIPGGQEILLKCLAASFDGTNAGSDWQPAVQIVGPSGQVLRTFPVSTPVAAGASADVTWFPRGGVGAGGGGSGIQFNTDNEGGYLYVQSNAYGPDGYGIHFVDVGGANFGTVGSVALVDGPGGATLGDIGLGGPTFSVARHGVTNQPATVDLGVGNDFQVLNGGFPIFKIFGGQIPVFHIINNGDHVDIENPASGVFFSAEAAAGGDKLHLGIVGSKVGFYGVAPVVRQATPVTLADVIALLQAVGLAT